MQLRGDPEQLHMLHACDLRNVQIFARAETTG